MTTKNRQEWTEDEESLLRELSSSLLVEEIAIKLNRTTKSIIARQTKLGITRHTGYIENEDNKRERRLNSEFYLPILNPITGHLNEQPNKPKTIITKTLHVKTLYL